MKRQPVCIQQQSEEDCGAACIASILKYYGRVKSIANIREEIGTGKQGTSLKDLHRGAERLGFNARPVKAAPAIFERIHEAPLPAIIHWKGYHWVILYGRKGRKFIVADPGVGLRYLSQKELEENWSGWVMLLLEPDSIRFSQQPEDQEDRGIWSRFLKRVLHYQGILFQTLLLNFSLGLLSLTSPFLIQFLTDEVLVRGDTQLLTKVAIAICVLQVISSGLRLAQSNLIAHFSQRLQLGLFIEFGRKILRLPLGYYEARRSGEIVSRLEDIQEVNQLVSHIAINLPSQFFIALVALAVMLRYSPKLTGAAFVLALLMTVSTIFFYPTLQQKTRKLLVTSAENQGVLVETFKGAMTLKTTTAEPQFSNELQSRFSSLANLTLRTIQIGVVNDTFSGLVAGIGSIALLWFGSSLVISKELTIGQLLAFNSMNGNLTGFIATLIGLADEFTRFKTATQRLNEVTETPAEQPDQDKKPWEMISHRTDVICDNLSFYHQGRNDLLVDFSVNIPGGKVIAMIGRSGCGKSTLAKLIAGLYTPKSGNIRVGFFNQQDLSIECWRKQVVLVPQDAHFWSRSILENFQLGNPNISFEQVVKACKITGADEFISQLPDRYHTILGEFGANLSGGQRQKLAIARALVNTPPILILDESTSALDPISEEEVLQAIFQHRKGQTTILISHRPNVIQQADWIILLDNGRLATQGTPKDFRNQGEHTQKFLVA